jgi:hypothetical protein
MSMSKYSSYSQHNTTRASNASLHAAQNRSIVGCLVPMIAITALVLGVLVIATQLGIF